METPEVLEEPVNKLFEGFPKNFGLTSWFVTSRGILEGTPRVFSSETYRVILE